MNRPIESITEGGPVLRGLVGVAVLGLIYSLWLLSGEVMDFNSNRISLFNALTNSLLTIGLLWIYVAIARSEQAQTELEERQLNLQTDFQSLEETQIEIMGAEFEPVIEVVGYSVGHTPPSDSSLVLPQNHPKRGDAVTLLISNPSTAIATNLRLRLIIDYLGPGGLAYGKDTPLSRKDRTESWAAKPGGVLRGEQSEVPFEGIAGLSYPPSTRDDTIPFSYCLSHLIDHDDVSLVRIGIVLQYDDRKGEEHKVELEGLQFSVSDWPANTPPTLEKVREEATQVPIGVIEDEYLRQGVPDIPPQYL